MPATIVDDIARPPDPVRDVDEAQAARRRWELLARVSRQLSGAPDASQALEQMAHLAVPEFADWCTVTMFKPDGSVERVAAVHRAGDKALLAAELVQRYPPGARPTAGLNGVFYRPGAWLQPRISDGDLVRVAQSPRHLELMRALGTSSGVGVPVVARGRTLGVVCFARGPDVPEYGPLDLAFGEELAGRAALAVENAGFHDEVKRTEANLRFLAEAGTLLSSLDEEETLENLSRMAIRHMADWCIALLLDGNGKIRRQSVAHVDPSKWALAEAYHQKFPLDLQAEMGLGKVVRTGVADWSPEVTEADLLRSFPDPARRQALHELGLGSYISVPLKSRDRVFGGLTLVLTSERRYAARDFALAEELARRAATALDNARLYHEAQEAIRARDAFLSIASHELNTPLTSMKLNLEALERRVPPSDPVHQKFQSVHRQVARLGSLVRELLDVSRITSGKLKLEPEPLDLTALCQEVIARLSDDLVAAGCALHFSADPGLTGSWDRMRLEQLVQNLLSNALKYGRGAPIDVELSGDGEAITLRVQDHGMGIDPEVQPRLFHRFERFASERHYSGFGLGLWIVKQVVDAMGGDIEVESTLGQGARFTVRLPRSLEGVPAR